MASTFYAFILLLALALEFNPSAGDNCINDVNWDSFKHRFNKKYTDCTEEADRHQWLTARKKKIDEHNAEFARGLHSFTLGLNALSDLTDTEYNTRLGFRPIKTSRAKRATPTILTFKNTVNVNTLNATVDWTASGWVSPVVNQGSCGSCWAYAATGTIESQYKNKTNVLVQLSQQNLISCASNPSPTSTGNLGCSGGDPKAAMKWAALYGQQLLSAYPCTSNGTGATGSCLYNSTQSVVQLSGYYNIDANESAIQQAVAQVGPVAVAIDASGSAFQSYKSGIYAGNCSQLMSGLNHAVQIVGYGTTNGTAYWLIKNSWGPTWGMNGYMMMARNVNMCGIKLYAAVPVVGTATVV